MPDCLLGKERETFGCAESRRNGQKENGKDGQRERERERAERKDVILSEIAVAR